MDQGGGCKDSSVISNHFLSSSRTHKSTFLLEIF